jgi:hypothetical protein
MKISRRTVAKALAAGGSAAALFRLLHANGAFAESVTSSKLQLDLSATGSITHARFRGLQRPVLGEVRLAGCTKQDGAVIHRSGQTVSFEREIFCGAHGAHVVDRYSPTAEGVRWRVEILGHGDPWTTPIEFYLQYPITPDVQFWTSWADPYPAQNPAAAPLSFGAPGVTTRTTSSIWHDPLVTMPPRDRKLYYGAPPLNDANPRKGFVPSETDLFSIPVATFSEPSHDAGLSVALALDDTLLDLTLDTSCDGSTVFTHLFHCISAEAPVSFTVDLIPHEASWRGGLRYLVQRYPEYFDPVNRKLAVELSGTAAYPNSRGPSIDAARMKAMAFRTIWMASFDFPYMGLFQPPVADNVPWPLFSPRAPSGSSGTITVNAMAQYARHMHNLGFHVLNYFNVTEFGAHMSQPWKAAAINSGSPDWEDPEKFLQAHFPGAVLRSPDGKPYYSWGGAVAMDPGDPAYQRFLLDQTQRQLKSFPESDGFCIDRLDWLRFYNQNRNDHVSRFDGQESESLVISWRRLMDQLAPEVHAAGKALFVNNHTKRIDLLREIDGIYDEFDYFPASMNTTALLGINRPVLGWTKDADNLRPDPDIYFQRNLYLGVYPTAPFPGNNHCILPDPWVDRQYLDYGPLLDAMRGKRWVLLPHPVSVAAGSAIANLFETPKGYVVPVMLGGADKEAVVQVKGIAANSAEALHPASIAWKPLHVVPVRGGKLEITVPLVRGCAMLRLR